MNQLSISIENGTISFTKEDSDSYRVGLILKDGKFFRKLDFILSASDVRSLSSMLSRGVDEL